MRPAFSVILLTTLLGAGQGLFLAMVTHQTYAFAGVLSPEGARGLYGPAAAVALALLAGGLVASFFHLGRPERAWRSAAMWRTSWLSREVIVLPAFIAATAGWALAAVSGLPDGLVYGVLPVVATVLALLLWYCTAMIYACLRFIQEWAHPLTVVNYTLIGLSSGLVLAGALAVLAGQARFVAGVAPWAIAVTLAAWFTRTLALRRNARLKPKSTLQSATGIRNPRLQQKAMGMTGGSFNTREFFHHATQLAVRRTRVGFQLLAFAVPLVLLVLAVVSGAALPWLLAVPLQFAGLLAERWFFFAQAQHPQNLYYQVVS